MSLVYLSLGSKPTLAYLETNYVEVYEKSEKQSPSNRTVDIPGLQTASERRTTSPANRTEDTRGSTLETNYVYSWKVLNISHDHRFNYSEEKKRVYDNGHKLKDKQTEWHMYFLKRLTFSRCIFWICLGFYRDESFTKVFSQCQYELENCKPKALCPHKFNLK